MNTLPQKTTWVIEKLKGAGVDTILYGSQGVSLYIGSFKEFGDIDLLIDQRWLDDDWNRLVDIMRQIGFELYDLAEHEFADAENNHVSFAGSTILIRDGIVASLHDITSRFETNGVTVTTLKPDIFKKAYEFSAKDGYRKDVRGKKDREVIALLNNYLMQVL